MKSVKIDKNLNKNVNESTDDNYSRFVHLLNSAKEKHLQFKIVKYIKLLMTHLNLPQLCSTSLVTLLNMEWTITMKT